MDGVRSMFFYLFLVEAYNEYNILRDLDVKV